MDEPIPNLGPNQEASQKTARSQKVRAGLTPPSFAPTVPPPQQPSKQQQTKQLPPSLNRSEIQAPPVQNLETPRSNFVQPLGLSKALPPTAPRVTSKSVVPPQAIDAAVYRDRDADIFLGNLPGLPPLYDPRSDPIAEVYGPSVGQAPESSQTSSLSQPMPAWLISMIVHVTLILMLALIPLAQEIGRPFIISVSTGQDEVDQEFQLSSQDDTANNFDSIAAAPAEPIVSESAVSLLDTLVGNLESAEVKSVAPTPRVETSLSGRTGPLKESLLAAYGGTADTEKAVAEGLAWLSKQQRADGAWSLRGPYSNGGFSENKPAATAMALIAFAGAGHHHQDGQYKSVVAKGLKYLLAQQDSDGCFAADTPDRQMMYAQGQATIALCELYGMTKDATLRDPAQHAVDFAEASQSPQGGWRYIPREDSDTSVTGWYVMALMSAKMAGLSTSKKTLENVDRYLDTVRHDGGSQYGYVTSSPPFPSMSAEGLLCREYLGWKRDDSRLRRGCELLAARPISTDVEERSYYYWYYATQALHHFGGQPWKIWNDVMVVELPRLQVKEGKEKGSWPSQHDPYGSAGGRIYSTCFAIYCLEVYYRHLPLYSIEK